MARNGVCFGAKQVLEGQTAMPFSPVVLTDNQEQQRTNVKRRNTAHKLWKLKSSQPQRFSNGSSTGRDIGPGVPAGGLPSALLGFEPVRLPSGLVAPGWLCNSQRQIYLESTSERCLWFDSAASAYRELHIGEDLAGELMLSGVATTTSLSSASASSRSGNSSSTSTSHAARHLVIMDLHKAAEAFKLDLNHLDRPAAMLAVYRGAEDAVPPDLAAKGLHEKLLRRLAAFRSRATDDILQGVLLDSIHALASEQSSASGIAGGVAIIVGAKLVVGVSRGAACVIADPLPGDMRDIRVAATSNDSSSSALNLSCMELDSRSAACILLHTGPIEEEAARAAAAHATKGHPRAGALTLMQGRVASGLCESRAAACARLVWSDDADEPAAKRARADKGIEKVRCRQILLRYVGCKQATDRVRRKPVERSVAEAEMAMREVLDTLEKAADPQAAFTQQVRSLSECSSSLKGGDLAGDVGWLRRPEVKPGEKMSKEVAARMVVIRAALALDIGEAVVLIGILLQCTIGRCSSIRFHSLVPASLEVSDVIVAEDGVHLLKRSA